MTESPSAHAAATRRRFVWFIIPVVAQAAVAFFVLPFTTAVLDPADFAVHALVAGFAALGTVFASLASPYILAHRFPTSSDVERKRAVTTLAILSLAASLLFLALFVLAWLGFASAGLVPVDIPLLAVLLGALVVPASAPWTIAQELLTLTGGARFFAIAVLLQAFSSTAVTLISLFYFEIGVLSLFAGGLTAAAVAGVLGLVSIRPYLGRVFEPAVAKETVKLALPLLLSNGLDAAFVVVERSVLAAFSGLTVFGIYTHSQQYMAVAANGVKALIRSIWPTSLAEAREGDGLFRRTGSFWRIGHSLVILAGVFFATIGRTAISLLTNDKFTDAHLFAAAWMALLLWQQSGRPQQALLFAEGRGDALAGARVRGTVAALILMPPLAFVLGTTGAAAARFVQAGIIRWGFGRAASRIRPTPWQDQLPVFGAGLIALTSLSALLVGTAPEFQVLTFILGCAGTSALYWISR